MQWPYLPDDYDGSCWVTIPNELYDPVKGQRLYREYLDQLVLAEELGFDGICVNEHHQTPWGGMPSPNIFAGMLTQLTSRARICILGNALPLYTPPQRVAEEIAALDVVSGGRIEAGLLIGAQPEYYSYNINPGEARGRFAEALELVLQAWTRPGPFAFDGRYYQYPYVNPWQRPLQQPHPPVWIPGAGSMETMELCAARGFGYSGLPLPLKSAVDQTYALFRKTWLAAGNEPEPAKLALSSYVYVADTYEEARRQYEPHFYYNQRLLNGAQTLAPGYMTGRSVMRMIQMLGMPDPKAPPPPFEEIERESRAIIGSPEQVAEKLCERLAETGAGRLFGFFHIGSMPDDMTRASLSMFAEHVLPVLRKEFPTGPDWPEAL
jgi:alkanesulfonate monooxygenase SsuD/methylene tetrahydromethanopterin reductase-like flavin-dependent oxidoreductase (luciferase family)